MVCKFWKILFSGWGGKALFLNHKFMCWACLSVCLRNTQFERGLLAGGLLIVPWDLTLDQKPWWAVLIYQSWLWATWIMCQLRIGEVLLYLFPASPCSDRFSPPLWSSSLPCAWTVLIMLCSQRIPLSRGFQLQCGSSNLKSPKLKLNTYPEL